MLAIYIRNYVLCLSILDISFDIYSYCEAAVKNFFRRLCPRFSRFTLSILMILIRFNFLHFV